MQRQNSYKKILKGILISLGFLIFATLLIPASKINAQETTTSTPSSENLSPEAVEEHRKNLENKLEKLEEQMAEQEKKIDEYQSQERTLKNEIYGINARTRQLNLKIEAVNVSLQKLNNDIYETQRQINQTQNKIETHKEALASALQNVYESDNQTLIVILLQNQKISDFFNNINEILLVQNNIQSSLKDIINLRQNLINQKQELALEKDDVENLREIRENQKQQLQYTKSRKSNLLEQTQNQESKYQEMLAETKKTAAEIRSRIFHLIGGGELTFEKAYDLAKLAEGATGVRAALTLAILSRESLLGKNVGQCSYQNAMHPERDIPVFKTILRTLGLQGNSTVTKVSCPNAHGAYGGAMGPAQFIPSTWAIYGGYEKESGNWVYNKNGDEIGSITGNKPSNPWRNEDAFAATSIYIKELIQTSGCQDYANEYDHILPHQKLLERCAAAKYYAGSRWWTYRFWYGDAVVNKAQELQKDIDILQES
ncbi:MAG TPA: lytic murein transglycosylase [Candidatus Paceibacterota bacterium]|nr:lytic murein transglycosylase [Candidatus Paceibacterota bacterium]